MRQCGLTKKFNDRKSENNHTWPLDFVHDGLIAYMNANDSESLISSARTDGYGFSQPALDQLADGTATALSGFPLTDFTSIVNSTHDHRANRLYVFGESANSASVTTNTDSGANNGKSLYINGNGNYCAGFSTNLMIVLPFLQLLIRLKILRLQDLLKLI